jgi:hypothetical protein
VSMFAGRLFSPDGDGVGRLEEGGSSGPGDRWPPHCDMNERTAGKYVSQAWLASKAGVRQVRGSPFQDRQWRHRRQVRRVAGVVTYRENEAWWLCASNRSVTPTFLAPNHNEKLLQPRSRTLRPGSAGIWKYVPRNADYHKANVQE